jgi:hypothetical protein
MRRWLRMGLICPLHERSSTRCMRRKAPSLPHRKRKTLQSSIVEDVNGPAQAFFVTSVLVRHGT